MGHLCMHGFSGFDHGVGHPLLLLYDAKAPNCGKNNELKDLGHYSEWPKVADAVIKADFPSQPVGSRWFPRLFETILIAHAKPIRGLTVPSVHWDEQVNTVGDGPGILVEGIREQRL
jgi:hypothetical protein